MATAIETYLGQLRLKLEARFDSECADQLLSEIRSHLVDAATDLEEEGVPSEEAERLSVARFDAPEKAAFLLPLGKQYGTGDRYWGRGAFWVSILAALGLIWYGVDPSARAHLMPSEVPPILALLLVLYGYACWKAKSFSMVRQSSVAVALMLLASGLFQRHVVDPAFGEGVRSDYEGLRVQRLLVPQTTSVFATPSIPGLAHFSPPLSGLEAIESGRTALASETNPIRAVRTPVEPPRAAPIYGMAPVSANPWDLTGSSLFPEVSQMLLMWLFFLLMVNAAVCWVGCIEHEQTGGVMLVQ